MTTDPDEHRWVHLVAGTIGVFVLLNQSFGTGTLEGLLHVSWGQVLPWVWLALGMFVSAFLVEAYRRRRRGGTQWFIEVYAALGGLFVLEEVIEDFLTPLTPSFLEPLFGHMGVWGVVLLAVLALAGLFLVLRRLWNAYWEMEPPAQEN